jgi:hypothetical protein
MTALSEWESFYVIVGSSAGALIGLQFVVLTLMAEMPVNPADKDAGDAFTSPTVVHFGIVLFLSAVLSAPWHHIANAEYVWGAAALAGVVYSIVVVRRFRAQTAYRPEFEDHLFHIILPFTAYTLLLGSAVAVQWQPERALFGVAAGILLLLFIGIHNAWDTVVYLVFVRKRKLKE